MSSEFSGDSVCSKTSLADVASPEKRSARRFNSRGDYVTGKELPLSDIGLMFDVSKTGAARLVNEILYKFAIAHARYQGLELSEKQLRLISTHPKFIAKICSQIQVIDQQLKIERQVPTADSATTQINEVAENHGTFST